MKSKRHRYNCEEGDYLPLFVLTIIIGLCAFAIESAQDLWEWDHFFHHAMGLFLCLFAMFKFFDLEGFVEAFAQYDVIAHKHYWYGFAYPFIELFLGLAYLSFSAPVLTYLITIAVMSVSATGVIQTMRTGKEELLCGSMGTVVRVPLSHITLIENISMGTLALLLLFFA